METLIGRVALVTGSSRGIGRAIAVALAREGAGIVVNFVSRAGEAEGVASTVRGLGRPGVSIRADVSSAPDVAALVQEAQDRLGPIDILVNNAGISRRQAIEDITEEDWDRILSANLKSCFLMTQAVLPGMRQRRWGRIINVSSVAAQVGGVVGPHYAASKAGMHGLTHFYASRLAKEGITVNAIAPALIATEMVSGNPDAKPDLIPIGRYGTVDEVATVAVMLAMNGYINGQTINVNGGWYMS